MTMQAKDIDGWDMVEFLEGIYRQPIWFRAPEDVDMSDILAELDGRDPYAEWWVTNTPCFVLP